MNKENFDLFARQFEEVLKKNLIIRACLSFRFLWRALLLLGSIFLFAILTCSLSWTIIYILCLAIITFIFFYKIFPTTRIIKKLYDSIIYKKKRLNELPEFPKLVINATNLDTGTMFSYTRTKSFDTTYKFLYNIDPDFDTSKLTIAKAVACSTAVPYAFSPTVLKFEVRENVIIKPKLVDGGVYDNQGIYRLAGNNSEYKTDIVIVSDASAPFVKKYYGINPLPVLGRIMSVMMKRIKSVQFLQSIYEDKEDELWEIGYFSLDWNYENCFLGFYNAVRKHNIRPHLIEFFNITNEMKGNKEFMFDHLKKSIGYEKIIMNGLSNGEIEFVKTIGTSLSSLSQDEINLLIKHAATLTEIQVKLYCPFIRS